MHTCVRAFRDDHGGRQFESDEVRKGEGGAEGERERKGLGGVREGERNWGIRGVRWSQGTVGDLLVSDGFCQRRVLSTGSGMERRQNGVGVSSSGSREDGAMATCDPP